MPGGGFLAAATPTATSPLNTRIWKRVQAGALVQPASPAEPGLCWRVWWLVCSARGCCSISSARGVMRFGGSPRPRDVSPQKNKLVAPRLSVARLALGRLRLTLPVVRMSGSWHARPVVGAQEDEVAFLCLCSCINHGKNSAKCASDGTCHDT